MRAACQAGYLYPELLTALKMSSTSPNKKIKLQPQENTLMVSRKSALMIPHKTINIRRINII